MPITTRRALRAVRPIALVAAVAAAITTTAMVHREASAAAPFHLRLVKSEPAAGTTIAPPTVIRLWFSEAATLSVTSVKLKGSDDKDVSLGAPTFAGKAADPVEVPVTGALAKGTYTVSFKTASHDMHPVTGDFSFTVR